MPAICIFFCAIEMWAKMDRQIIDIGQFCKASVFKCKKKTTNNYVYGYENKTLA